MNKSGKWLIILWFITSKYGGWVLIGTLAAIRTNTVHFKNFLPCFDMKHVKNWLKKYTYFWCFKYTFIKDKSTPIFNISRTQIKHIFWGLFLSQAQIKMSNSDSWKFTIFFLISSTKNNPSLLVSGTWNVLEESLKMTPFFTEFRMIKCTYGLGNWQHWDVCTLMHNC